MAQSPNPEQAAFKELEKLVQRLTEELTSFRKRALTAEGKLKKYETSSGHHAPGPERARAIEVENYELRRRLEVADARSKNMLDRVRFLRQQHEDSTK